MKISTLLFLLFLFSGLQALHGSSATWKNNPISNDWNTAANWTPNTVPNGPNDVATFFPSSVTSISVSAPTEVNAIQFWANGLPVTIYLMNDEWPLLISGSGLTDHSTTVEDIVTTTDGAGARGRITFSNSASAGNAVVLTNQGGVVSGAAGGLTQFLDTSTAANAILIANGGSNGGGGGLISFAGDASGGLARIELFGNGTLDISGHSAPGVVVGSVEGSGLVNLGGNNLTVGSNNLSANFSGTIQESGALIKIGAGTLTLGGASTYTGGTLVKAGTLLLEKPVASGSNTGSGTVQVRAGILGGTGRVGGSVTIGDGRGAPAVLAPGIAGPGTFLIAKKLIFNADGIYNFDLNSDTLTADKVIAKGVTIASGARFSFMAVTGALPVGTVFTIIDNTAATPIAGNFTNLPDGSIFTQSGNVFRVDYEGGDGNDLTLTVVQ